MPSQWLAIEAETDPLSRARELQRSWERLLSDGALGRELPPGATTGLRPTIVDSWRRSLATGLDPTDLLAPIEADESEVVERWFEHPLGSLTHVLAERLRKLAEESRSVVVLTDASGLILHRVGDEWLKERASEQNLVEGARYSEAADGTNGIGTALAADHAFQVFAFEHFNERHHEWICSGAPVHDPVSGETIGLIDLSTLWKFAQPRSLELVTDAARAIEQSLLEVRRDQDARLRRRYGDLMTRSTDLLVNRDGHVLAGAEREQSKTLDVPADGGEVDLGDGSVAVAASLGQGEAYLLRRATARHARSAPAEVLEGAEKHVRELVTEQSALRQVATLVARESAPDQLFAAVAEQVARVFAVPHVRLVRFEAEASVVVAGFSEGDRELFPIGSRWPLDTPGVMATVRETGRPARVEDYADVTGEVAALARDAGLRSAVASPIVVERRLWGAMVVYSLRHEPFPEETEARLTDFTELVATAIANAESRVAVGRLVEEQLALRRVATLVAGGTGADDLFAAVAGEVQQLLGADGSAIVRFEDDGTGVTVGIQGGPYAVGTRTELDPRFVVGSVRRTRRAARFDTDDPEAAEMPAIMRDWGIRSAVASPIVVEGELWGAMVVASRRSLPQESEARLGDFTDLVATAVANTQARQEVTALADEQAALRRVATLVASRAQPSEVFWAVSDEVGRLFGTEFAVVGRFEPDGALLWEHTFVTSRGRALDLAGADRTHERRELGEFFTSSEVFRTGRSARASAARWDSEEGETAERLRALGIVSTVGSPIIVEGELWGAMLVATTDAVLPFDTEERLENFTELVATSIANAESRAARAVLTDEQAALRRVATLVAQGTSPHDLFEAVAEEVGRLLPVGSATMGRFEPDGTVTTVASWSTTDDAFPTGRRWPTEGTNVAWLVLQTGRAAHLDDFSAATDPIGVAARDAGVKSAVGSPIVVEGQLWGVMTATSTEELMPPDTEVRLASFTELVATAIANAESQSALEQLADEQAALRRVATLVAQDAPPAEIFSAVSEEVEGLFDAGAAVLRFENLPPALVFVGISSVFDIPIGTRWEFQEGMASAEVYRTGRSARVDAMDVAPVGRELGVMSSVATPIVVEGRLWGAVSLGSTDEQLPPDAEERLMKFTELVATAIANAEGKSELAASRRRIVAAADETRRRIERNLHDGTQQRLVSLGLAVRAAEANLAPERQDVRDQLSRVAIGLVDAVEDLQEISRGIHPAILSKGGLGPALRTLAHRSAIPVDLDITTNARLAEPIEVAAYFVASEALANAAKHSDATRIDVSLERRDGNLLLSIRDDGVGGADAARGSGIVGLHDRVEALGGSLRVDSPPGEGTHIAAQLPLDVELQRPV